MELLPVSALQIEVHTSNPPCTSQTKIDDLAEIPSDHWASDEILEVVNCGYMDILEDGTFQLDKVITRGEAAQAIVRALGISLHSNYELKATDVPVSHQYYKEIRKLAEIGVIQNADYFYPNSPLKRSQVSVLIALAFKVEVDSSNHKSFKDYKERYWAKNYIESLADVNIISGTSPTTFSPNSNVTRAQLAFLLIRGQEFLNKVNKLEIIYDYLSKDYISTINTHIKWTNEVITLVNIERKKVGVEPLNQDLALNQLAVIKAKDMISRSYFDHNSPFYGYPWDMATLFDYTFVSLGENIARNFTSPKDVVEAWMASPSHKENILKDSYTNIGVGIQDNGKGSYVWVQLFSSR